MEQWQALFYYKNGESQIKDEAFFLGQSQNIEEELAELRRALGSQSPQSQETDVRCRFPARVAWLAGHLNQNVEPVPSYCRDYWNFASKVKGDQLSIVFPAEFYGNPASMFGHTFLKLSELGQPDLLSHGISYGADISDPVGLKYAFKGIFGFYQGYFSVDSYYKSLNLYNDMEDRDIWEFKLNINQDKVDFLVQHLWELREIAVDYYFFSTNCSSLLLDLLRVVEPQLDRNWGAGTFYFPLNLVYKLRDRGFISSVHYRPSMGQRLSYLSETLTESTRESLDSLEGEFQKEGRLRGNLQDEAMLYSYWAEKANYEYYQGDLGQEEYSRRYFASIGALAKMKSHKEAVIEPKYRVIDGHYPKLLAVGMQDQGGSALSLRIRPAMHGEGDHPGGFKLGSILSIMDGRLKLASGESVKIDALKIIHLANWRNFDPILPKSSWEVKAGYESVLGAGYVHGLVGAAKSWRGELLSAILLGPRLDTDGVELSPSMMAIIRFRARFSQLFLNLSHGLVAKDTQSTAEAAWRVSHRNGIKLSWQRLERGPERVSLAYNYYL